MDDHLDQILAELDCENISQDYILKGIIVTSDNTCIDVDRNVLDIFLNKTPENVTDEEQNLIEGLFGHFEPGNIYCELKIVIDLDRIKQDIKDYVEILINQHFR